MGAAAHFRTPTTREDPFLMESILKVEEEGIRNPFEKEEEEERLSWERHYYSSRTETEKKRRRMLFNFNF